MKFLCIIGSFLFSPSFVWAATKEAPKEDSAPQIHALMTPAEQDIRLRAQKKLYPGGRDEDALKVQAQLPVVTRKMAPATEAPVEDISPDTSND
jgi:hypothetical protein